MAEIFKAKITARFGEKISPTKIAERLFRRADRDRSGGLVKDEFKNMLRGTFTDDEVEQIYEEMDVNKNGTLELEEIKRVLRADMSEERKAIVSSVFKAADSNGDGVITMEDLRPIINVELREEIINGTKTKDQVFEEFLNIYETDPEKRNGEVTEEELIDYYSKVSPYYFTDDSFKMYIKSQWHCTRVDASLDL